MRAGVGKVFGRAAAVPLNLGVLAAAIIGAAVFASWPIAAIGGVAYAALMASDISSPEFRARVLRGRARARELPAPRTIVDPATRAAVERIAAARRHLDGVVKQVPERIARNVRTALAAVDELVGHGAALAQRAEELARYVASADATAARRDADELTQRARATRDAATRASYEAAAAAAHERLTALADIATARERVLAHLAQIESAIAAVPAKLVRLRALDDQASDALTGDVGAELERMNIDLRAFEDALVDIAEVS